MPATPHQHPTTRPSRPAPGDTRETEVLQAVVDLVDSLVADFDVVEVLTDLTERCAQLLDIASAGLLLVGPGHELQLMTATSSRTHDLELFQLQTHQGPCLDCYATGQPVSITDLHLARERWPRFTHAAIDAGFASVHAVPMRAQDTVIGALGLFGTTPGQLADADVTVAQTLAHIATVAILQEPTTATADTLTPRLRDALTRRVVVDQARGLISERLDVTVDHAFTLLRTYARSHHRHLSELAHALMHDRDEREHILTGLTDPPTAPNRETAPN